MIKKINIDRLVILRIAGLLVKIADSKKYIFFFIKTFVLLIFESILILLSTIKGLLILGNWDSGSSMLYVVEGFIFSVIALILLATMIMHLILVFSYIIGIKLYE